QRLATTLALLGQFTAYSDIDWQTPVNRIAELEAEKRRLEQQSNELGRINAQLAGVDEKITEAERARDDATGKIGKLADRPDNAGKLTRELDRPLDEPACEQARTLFPRLDERVAGRRLATPEDCDSCQLAVTDELNTDTDRLGVRQSRVANQVVAKMSRF